MVRPPPSIRIVPYVLCLVVITRCVCRALVGTVGRCRDPVVAAPLCAELVPTAAWPLEPPHAASASAAAIGAIHNRRLTLVSISVPFFGLLVEQPLQRLANGIHSAAHEQKDQCDHERAFARAAGWPGRDRERDGRSPATPSSPGC